MTNKYKLFVDKVKADYGVAILDVKEENGSVSLYVDPSTVTEGSLGGLGDKAVGSVLRRQRLTRDTVDLLQDDKPIYEQDIAEVYKKSRLYYVSNEVYGSVINSLTNLACKGFENDSSDPQIKYFFDQWNFDVNFKQVLRWVFLEFFRSGFVRTYKVIGKYTPGISYIVPPEELTKTSGKRRALGAAKKRWSKKDIPIKYTVLNPEVLEITGSLLFDDTSLTIKPNKELVDMLNKPSSELTSEDKAVISKLPAKTRKAFKEGKGVVLDPAYVGAIDYNKMPYERYPYPRGSRVFDTLVYKKSLRDADMSTLDGITNYILKITIGNDKYPVTSQAQLEKVAELFNTTSKAFDVVYNHTLKIEKIVSPEIESILGKRKYEQVNDDLYVGLTFPRVLLDGGNGDLATAEVTMSTKALLEEISYAREQVSQWVYSEYQSVAEALGFKSIPKVRWDQTILRNLLDYMNTISKLVDRRMLSYRTALEQLGFDFSSELANARDELPIVKDEGAFGIIGSPWQQAKLGLQATQNAPKGTPSEGRPAGDTVNDNDSRVGDSEQTSARLIDDELIEKVLEADEDTKYKLIELLNRA